MCHKMQGYFVETLKGRMAYLRKPDGQKRGKGKGTPSPVAVQRKSLMPLRQISSSQQAGLLRHHFLLWQLYALVHTSIVYI